MPTKPARFCANQLLRWSVSLLVPVVVAVGGGLITYGSVQSRVTDQDLHIQRLETSTKSDHDLLIRVDQGVSDIRETVKRIDERIERVAGSRK